MHVLVRPVSVCGGRSARDNNFMLGRLLCLAQFGKDAVGSLYIHPGLHACSV